MSITLPPLPSHVAWPATYDAIRARDLEVARLVLEGAAKEAHGYLLVTQAAAAIRALEVRHHE